MPDLRVYLDHLIGRENLRYHRTDEPEAAPPMETQPSGLRLQDLLPDQAYGSRLKKPDFQRATVVWTPEDCVSLLESVVVGQVVPSIIMWSSENGYDYVLDGAHRLSAVIAWLHNDWGDKLPKEHFLDDDHAREVRKAAEAVRRLVNTEIGAWEDFKAADVEFSKIVDAEGAPRKVLSDTVYNRARFYQNLTRGAISFKVQWVHGNHAIAEASFLKINKSGHKLTPWETMLVENRDSSFARAVMSTANPTSAEYYWPPSDQLAPDEVEIREGIVRRVVSLSELLLKPTPGQRITTPKLPLIAPSGREQRPARVAEFLTVSEGQRGTAEESASLMARDLGADASEIIANGDRLLEGAETTLAHLTGDSPRALGIVPAYYFYTGTGTHIRGLFYGFLTWLLAGSETDVLARKRTFSAFRGPFERAYVAFKDSLVRNISRRTGSGPEVTVQVASFFDVLLGTVVKHSGRVDTDAFFQDARTALDAIRVTLPKTAPVLTSAGRLFSPSMKRAALLDALFESHMRCGICQGALDPELGVQHDHIHEHAEGGPTASDNQRLTHPFCNNNRTQIETLQAGVAELHYPPFSKETVGAVVQQLSFLTDPDFFGAVRVREDDVSSVT